MGNRNAKGFTLIEMAVVLVIIGLLFAGVVLAQSLIRSSNVQTIISDVAMYQSAISQFKQKYNEMPGDMTDATNNWGTNPHCSTNGVGTGTQTCNGNGNGRVDLKLLIAPFEQFLVWQHLANGGFISGQYSGTSWPAGSPYHVVYCSPGNNCPGGRVNQSQAYFLAYSTGSFGLLGSTANYWAQGPGHYLGVGLAGASSGYPAYPLLTAPEAFSLDSKVDDGLPGQGVWKSFEATGGAGYLPNCVVQSGTTSPPSDGSIASEATAVYYTAYSNTLPACSFAIRMNF
jgi:prepilin-type N-terminal cleavage/methylation domain-containing protein